jgi:hypothetical protein
MPINIDAHVTITKNELAALITNSLREELNQINMELDISTLTIEEGQRGGFEGIRIKLKPKIPPTELPYPLQRY